MALLPKEGGIYALVFYKHRPPTEAVANFCSQKNVQTRGWRRLDSLRYSSTPTAPGRHKNLKVRKDLTTRF
jgi:hypothetical protein